MEEMKLKLHLEVELEYDANLVHSDEKDAVEWFAHYILTNTLNFLFNNDIGDIVGGVKVLMDPEEIERAIWEKMAEAKKGERNDG